VLRRGTLHSTRLPEESWTRLVGDSHKLIGPTL
jgi:hypothetical protein